MRILLINAVCGTGSTGKITAALAQELEQQGHTVKIAYGRDDIVPEQYRRYAVRIGSTLEVTLHGIYTRVTDRHGFGSKGATRRFLRWAEDYNPDLLWLHNIHGYYIHIDMLFRWIKKRPGMQVKWTLHDCWAFTGHCAYFDMVGCDKWKTGCHHCPQKDAYPATVGLDNSRENYAQKRQLFTGVKNLTLITPSRWLAELSRQSFLKDYPVEVRYNTVNRAIFQATAGNFRERYGLQNKKIILGVASIWERRKGLEDFVNLAGRLTEDCRIVLVGLTPQQARQMPKNIICISRTDSPRELAQIYTAADVFFNPTYEDNYPTVNLEAEACGTRVITYDTGGSRETLSRADSLVIPVGQWQRIPELI